MASVPTYIGEYRRGDTINYPIDNRDWDVNVYDIVDNSRRLVIVENETLVTDTDPIGQIKFVSIDLVDDLVGSPIYRYKEGNTYSVILKETTGDPGETDNPNHEVIVFRIVPSEQLFIGTVEKNKKLYFVVKEQFIQDPLYDVIEAETGTVVLQDQDLTKRLNDRIYTGVIDTTDTDFTTGRTYFIRVKDSGSDPGFDKIYSFSILPPLEHQLMRLLALAGENLVLDNFSYDQAGNITALRVRLFADATSADNATQGTTDPESGEVAAFDVTQEHNVPRNVRTFHKSVLSFLSSQYPENP